MAKAAEEAAKASSAPANNGNDETAKAPSTPVKNETTSETVKNEPS